MSPEEQAQARALALEEKQKESANEFSNRLLEEHKGVIDELINYLTDDNKKGFEYYHRNWNEPSSGYFNDMYIISSDAKEVYKKFINFLNFCEREKIKISRDNYYEYILPFTRSYNTYHTKLGNTEGHDANDYVTTVKTIMGDKIPPFNYNKRST